jgi:hypothetical protein
MRRMFLPIGMIGCGSTKLNIDLKPDITIKSAGFGTAAGGGGWWNKAQGEKS